MQYLCEWLVFAKILAGKIVSMMFVLEMKTNAMLLCYIVLYSFPLLWHISLDDNVCPHLGVPPCSKTNNLECTYFHSEQMPQEYSRKTSCNL